MLNNTESLNKKNPELSDKSGKNNGKLCRKEKEKKEKKSDCIRHE